MPRKIQKESQISTTLQKSSSKKRYASLPKGKGGECVLKKTRTLEAFEQMLEATPIFNQQPSASDSLLTPLHLRVGGEGDHLVTHLSFIVHAVHLVAQTERAQRGMLLPLRQRPHGKMLGEEGNASLNGLANIHVTQHWLGAVADYCNYTVTLDDIAKAALAFPEWMYVHWFLKEKTLYSSSDGVFSARQRRSDFDSALTPAPSAGELAARLYLRTAFVPSAEEAEKQLRLFLNKDDAHSQEEEWRKQVVRWSAMDAYLAQKLLPSSFPALPADARAPGVADSAGALASREQATAHLSGVSNKGTGSTKAAFLQTSPAMSLDTTPSAPSMTQEETKALLAMVSPELRNSLSETKLQQVLLNMKKEALGERAKQYARIEHVQEEERLVYTYIHMRSLFGTKKTEMGAVQLLQQLQKENRFEDHRNILTQLSLLFKTEGAGLCAVTLVAGENDVAQQTSGVHPTSPTGATIGFKKIEALEKLSSEELENVLIRLDRSNSSLKGLLDTLARRHRHEF